MLNVLRCHFGPWSIKKHIQLKTQKSEQIFLEIKLFQPWPWIFTSLRSKRDVAPFIRFCTAQPRVVHLKVMDKNLY